MAKVTAVWERRTTDRPGQAHVFGAEGRTLCGTAQRTDGWARVAAGTVGRMCATCRRKVDPENAPKAPSWRRPL